MFHKYSVLLRAITVLVCFCFVSSAICSCSGLETSYEPQYGKVHLAVSLDEKNDGTKENFEALLAKRIEEYEKNGESEIKIHILFNPGAEENITENYLKRIKMNISSYKVIDKSKLYETEKYIAITVPVENINVKAIEKLSSLGDITQIIIKPSTKYIPLS